MADRPFRGRRVLVTGGAGFLGGFVVQRLREAGADVVAPRSADYDLVDRAAARRLLADAQPDLVIHLAARVGGIGANLDNPGRFFFENLMMGTQLFEECRLARGPKLVAAGTVRGHPEHPPAPVPDDALSHGDPEEAEPADGPLDETKLPQSLT